MRLGESVGVGWGAGGWGVCVWGGGGGGTFHPANELGTTCCLTPSEVFQAARWRPPCGLPSQGTPVCAGPTCGRAPVSALLAAQHAATKSSHSGLKLRSCCISVQGMGSTALCCVTRASIGPTGATGGATSGESCPGFCIAPAGARASVGVCCPWHVASANVRTAKATRHRTPSALPSCLLPTQVHPHSSQPSFLHHALPVPRAPRSSFPRNSTPLPLLCTPPAPTPTGSSSWMASASAPWRCFSSRYAHGLLWPRVCSLVLGVGVSAREQEGTRASPELQPGRAQSASVGVLRLPARLCLRLPLLRTPTHRPRLLACLARSLQVKQRFLQNEWSFAVEASKYGQWIEAQVRPGVKAAHRALRCGLGCSCTAAVVHHCLMQLGT